MISCKYLMQRRLGFTSCILMLVYHNIRRYYSKTMFCRHRREWFVKVSSTESIAAMVYLTIKGAGLSITNFCNPFAMRRIVFSASGFLRSNIEGHGKVQSIHSAAVRHALTSPFLPVYLPGLRA